jgi:hypothetical protein
MDDRIMNVNRILRLAESLYGEDTRRQIFEPLVADVHHDCAGSPPSLARRTRWWLAVAVTFLLCAPRAFTVRMPRGLWFEVAGRVVLFGALAFALLQYLNGTPATGTRDWLAIVAASLSFVIIPAVWRIRVSALPLRERRTFVTMFIAVIAAVQAILGDGGWGARLTLAATAPFLAVFGWKLRDAERERVSPLAAQPWVRAVMVAAALAVASWPVKLSLGIGLFEPRWDGDRFVIYLLAALVIVTMGRERQEPESTSLHPPRTRST